MRYWPGCTTDPKWIAEFEANLRRIKAASVQPRRTKMLEVVAAAIQDADDRHCPDGYANVVDDENVSDWSVFLADAALIALAEQGFNIVFDPIAAVSDMKTWPQDVRIENGLKD